MALASSGRSVFQPGTAIRAKIVFLLLGLAVATLVPPASAGLSLSHQEALRIGRKVWQNECGGSVAGLTSWNTGENFASLGIGHFIWYPAGVRGPFEESFPAFIRYVEKRGAKLPDLLLGRNGTDCPWNSRAEFLAAGSSAKMKNLQIFLVDTIDLQADFLVERLRAALPKMLQAAAPAEREKIEQRFNRLANRAQGCYALIDYVNFKGEGVLATERYEGRGWGLLQVLEGMSDESGASPVGEFADSAERVLRERVKKSPPARNEKRWLEGWLRRVNSYH
ncbi:MAG: hypothetical protein M3Q46_08795 [Verrucomicrobiota bacterium]|nr:hypothetical protein [Verrucomicrobiota bacterium]